MTLLRHLLRFLGLCACAALASTALFTVPYWAGLLSERYLDHLAAPHSALYTWCDGIFTLLVLLFAFAVVMLVCAAIAGACVLVAEGATYLWKKARP